jgi:hypothetical protein
MNCLGGRQRSDKATGRNLFTDDLWNVCRRFPLLCRQRGKTPSVFAIRNTGKCWLDLEPVRKPPNYHPKIKISFQRKNRLHLKQRFVVVEDKKRKKTKPSDSSSWPHHVRSRMLALLPRPAKPQICVLQDHTSPVLGGVGIRFIGIGTYLSRIITEN